MEGGTRNVTAGIVGGIAGGVLFGLMMQAMDMLPMVAMLAQSKSVGLGWVVHLVISVVFGVVFALVLGPTVTSYGRGLVAGAAYGVVAWVIGALVVMPLWLGMSQMVFAIGGDQVMSLVGHLVFGIALGLVYRRQTSGEANPSST